MKALWGKSASNTCSVVARLLRPCTQCLPIQLSLFSSPSPFTMNSSVSFSSIVFTSCVDSKTTRVNSMLRQMTTCTHRQAGLNTKANHLNLLSWIPSRCLHSSPLLGGGSRMIPEGRKEKKSRVKVKEKTVLLIDDDGTNLGEMDGGMAAKLSESKGLKIVLVNREGPERLAVYKLMSGKKLYEEEKIKKQKSKKDPRQVTKEISVSTKIDAHDLKVKLAHMREILTKLHNVRVVVELARIPRFSENREEKLRLERERQVELMSEIEAGLEEVGVKLAKENMRKNRLQCTFRSTVSEYDA